MTKMHENEFHINEPLVHKLIFSCGFVSALRGSSLFL